MARTILAYGKTRTTKTSQFRFIAEEVWKRHGKRSRFVTTDTGSLWAPIQDLVDADIVRPLLLPIDPAYNPQSTMRYIRAGKWPKDKDGNGIAVVRPTNEKPNWQIPGEQPDKDEIGALGIESLTSFGDGTMRDLREKQRSASPIYEEGGEKFASNSMAHYGLAHGEILDLLNSAATLPYHYVYMTALEGIGEDDDGPVKRAILGPKVPGKAITETIPSRVNDCLHLVDYVDKDKSELRCYITSHPSEVAGKKWPAGLRSISIPTVLAEVRKKWPNGYFKLSEERGIGEYLDMLPVIDRLAAEYTANLKKGGTGNGKES